MPYKLSWYLENRILYSIWSGTVTPEEMTASRHEAEHFLAGVDPEQVHTIIDMSQVINFRVGVHHIKQDAQPNTELTTVGGWMVYVGVGRIIKFLIQIGARVAGMRTKTVETLPEALEFLAQVDPTLATALKQKHDD